LKEIILSSPLILKRERGPLSNHIVLKGIIFQVLQYFIFPPLDIYPMGVYHDVEKERRKI